MKRLTFIMALLVVGIVAYACGGGSTNLMPDADRLSGIAPLSSDLGSYQRGSTALGDEILYMSNYDDGNNSNGNGGLYQVSIDTTLNQADFTKLCTLPFAGPQIGTTADGSRIYVLDYYTSVFGYWDVEAATFNMVKDSSGNNIKIHLAGGAVVDDPGEVTFSDATEDNSWGNLYFSTAPGYKLYKLDPATGEATDLGYMTSMATGNHVKVSGGDITFDADGRFYLLTMASTDGNGNGIWEITGDFENGGNLAASWVRAIPAGTNFPGLAITENGAGDMVGSEMNDDNIVVFNDDDTVTNYPMYLGDNSFNHQWGDLAVGRLGPYPTETAWGEGERFGKGWAMYFTYTGETVTTNLLAGQYIDVGDVTAEIVGDDLVVTYDVTGTWNLTDSHLFVGLELPNKSAPGKFPYHHDDSADGVYTVPLADIDGYYEGCTVYVAAHGVVQSYVG